MSCQLWWAVKALAFQVTRLLICRSLQLRPHVWIRLAKKTSHPAPAVEDRGGNSPLRARLAALEMELKALKQGSDAGGSGALAGADLAATIKQQTVVLKDTLSSWGNQSSGTRDVFRFYEEFEGVCALANNREGMPLGSSCQPFADAVAGAVSKHTPIYTG